QKSISQQTKPNPSIQTAAIGNADVAIKISSFSKTNENPVSREIEHLKIFASDEFPSLLNFFELKQLNSMTLEQLKEKFSYYTNPQKYNQDKEVKNADIISNDSNNLEKKDILNGIKDLLNKTGIRTKGDTVSFKNFAPKIQLIDNLKPIDSN